MRRIGQAEELLNGHYRRLTRALREEMEQEAADLHFEQAAALRDRIRAIEVLGKRQKVIAGICADTDIWGVYRGALKCGSAVLHIEDGSVTGRDLNLFAAPQDESEQMILSALLPQYYLNKSVLPREILLPCEIEGADELAQILTERAGRKVTLHVPQRGDNLRLVELACKNAFEEAERVTGREERVSATLTLLGKMLAIPAPKRMESFDISNISGTDIVASMVVFQEGKPKKSDYKRFKVEGLTDQDDYASMRQVVTRRFVHYKAGDKGFDEAPDLLLIDGGVTHAKVAVSALQELNLSFPVFGMVKDDRHRTRALVTPEGEEIRIDNNQAIFSLIGQIQEETHRFAITYHHESHIASSGASVCGIPNWTAFPASGQSGSRSCCGSSNPSPPSDRRPSRSWNACSPKTPPPRCIIIFMKRGKNNACHHRKSPWCSTENPRRYADPSYHRPGEGGTVQRHPI